jgi:ubiquinone/menaquinone biosynthesis C-methylase UbiE
MPNSMDLKNLRTFESKDIVAYYAAMDKIIPSERLVLDFLKADLNNMVMLDIGVGGGRTTAHFANLVKEYIGIDYSKNMIDACNIKFSKFENVRFLTCDARSMRIFKDNYFDFILFSFNGIDSISHEGRIAALREIYRVSKKEGYFYFSSHNIQSINNIFRFYFSNKPIRLFKNIILFILLRIFNRNYNEMIKRNYAVINDGFHHLRLFQYYIKPEFQLDQLHNCGFQDISIYSSNGKEIHGNLSLLEDDWLYYLCRIRK